MKKAIIIIAMITLALMCTQAKDDYVVIPKESVRFRIIPNSNTPEDLLMKEKVKTEISDVIYNIEDSNSIEETRENIKDAIPTMENKISKLFESSDYNKTFEIKYGMNYFPEKTYKGVKYESGNYESVVVEIGKTEGDNYWCVLFPPLCLLEAEVSEEVEYKFFVTEILKKFFK